jgi:F-type H+-transporting ATPase subunit beta
MDVLGRPIDERRPGQPEAGHADPPQGAPAYDELSPSQDLLETGIKVIDPGLPVREGRQGRPVRRRRRRQDRQR